MPTSDDRREVASALRGDTNEMFIPQSRVDFEAMTYQQAAYRFWNMCRSVRSAADVDIAYDTTSVLADLIDPTCHDFGGEEGTNGEGYDFACSSCGYVCDLPEPNYCPSCGARVVRDDE